ncbi:hypothetical protein CONPUDRAFT_127468 [Coniophora puteana RWD-64-598 SS2]|uniref:Pkinase-domain-containing protein n=1 Tax=Coniophora puteana (strain RWD-64-598) TaxID=741705 RepID=A0A5M3MJG0_CONPW|nr:uncharacterized protein CONPUDRAFT_127468 [Coniophora puteana RWD-64-598 SS2]EIW79378.1 hypothetical protein CONPUDRAFT_127468 [Coniophora puteana RWD-64-598 SS2]
MTQHDRVPGSNVHFHLPRPGSSSRTPEPSTSSQFVTQSTSSTGESASKSFGRLRSSFGASIKTATKSRSKIASPEPNTDEFATVSRKGKGRAQDPDDHHETPAGAKDKSKMGMLKRLESKVGLRGRMGKDSTMTAAALDAHGNNMGTKSKGGRHAGLTSFITPTLRGASISSPALHLLSPSTLQGQDSSDSTTPSASSDNNLTRERSRRCSMQPTPTIRGISGPSPLASKRNGSATPDRAGAASPRSAKQRPAPIFAPPPPSSRPSVERRSTDANHRRSVSRDRETDIPSPPPTPTPTRPRQGQLSAGLNRRATASSSATHLPLASPTTSHAPSTSTAAQHARSPSGRQAVSARVGSPEPANLAPLSSSPPRRVSTEMRRPSTANDARKSAEARRVSGEIPRRQSIDARRPSVDARRPSVDGGRRTSIDQPRRVSLDPQQRRQAGSPVPPRAISPTSGPSRSRAASPTGDSIYGGANGRALNFSSASLVGHGVGATTEQRDLVRRATSAVCREFRKPPAHLAGADTHRDWEEVEVRVQPLMRLERMWGGKNGSGIGGGAHGASSTQVNVVASPSSAGEERERKLFCEALRDGIVLCQLMNKHFPIIVRIDLRDDGFNRTSNITRFLAACSSKGVSSDDLFYRDDLIEATPETLARVAQTILALLDLAYAPQADRAKVISGQGKKGATSLVTNTGPYSPGSVSRAASSTPNLVVERPTSPVAIPPLPRNRGSRAATGLDTVRSNSPLSGASSAGTTRNAGSSAEGSSTHIASSDRETDNVPPISHPPVPPRSPLRVRSSSKRSDELFAAAADEQHSTGFEPPSRQSRASSNLTDTTAFSSLLDFRRSNSNQGKFSTIRTATTEATSFASDTPSLTRTEASALCEDMSRRRERRPSESAGVDLMSLTEEEETNASANASARSSPPPRSRERRRQNGSNGGYTAFDDDTARASAEPASRVRLGKGKWPDDFLDAFQGPSSMPSTPVRPIPIVKSPGAASAAGPGELFPLSSSPLSGAGAGPLSASPSRKLAIVGASRHNDSGDSVVAPGPRRPTHRPRHSVDVPGFVPRDSGSGSSGSGPSASILRRDVSPSGQPRLMLRRQSTHAGQRRNGVYIPRTSIEGGGDGQRPGIDSADGGNGSAPVPFPRARAGSGEHGLPSPTSLNDVNSGGGVGGGKNLDDVPRARGRFRSEVEGTRARRRSRPTSYDEMGQPKRSRFESMVNLGVASNRASASDLLSRDSMDGGAVRQTIIVKEDGRTMQLSLGNCIGRGQFGVVYRALNITTGQMVAVKRIRLEGLKEDEVTQLMKEVDLMKRLGHPSIVKYEGMARDEDFLNIVLEYAESGSLGQTLKAFGKLNERLVASYVVKILEGLHYLHGCDVVHCDLKAANILTTKTGNIKLSDFGVSLNLRAMEREKDVAGTPNWMAPEVIELKGASTKSDIWSLGCTVIELLTGRPPYGEIANSMTVMFRIVEDDMPPIPEGCSEPLVDFLQQCFQKNPEDRPDAELLCEHQWLKKNWDALQELRPQDSIPFLRRVSADIHKTDVARLLSFSNVAVDVPESAISEDTSNDYLKPPTTPMRRRLSSQLPTPISPMAPITPMVTGEEPISQSEHSFVKTTFKKNSSMICRVCMEGIKKSAVICDQCNFIAHPKCAPDAPPTCHMRRQLLLYAQYAERGDPHSMYSNPMLVDGSTVPSTGPGSDVSFVTPSPRPSMDGSALPPHALNMPAPNPPTAFRFIQHAFRRSRSSLSTDLQHSTDALVATSQEQEDIKPATLSVPTPKHKPSKLHRTKSTRTTERPHSLSSNSTARHPPSMRTVESHSSRPEASRKSLRSFGEADSEVSRSPHARPSAVPEEGPMHRSPFPKAASAPAFVQESYGAPGNNHHDHHAHFHTHGRSKSANCTIQ